jgi:hypothetical protein
MAIRFPLLALVSATGWLGCSVPVDSPQARQMQMYGLVQKFDRFDYDGDGFLTRAELQEGVAESGSLNLTEEEWQRVMKAYDTNRDGRISRREAQTGADRGPGILGVPERGR